MESRGRFLGTYFIGMEGSKDRYTLSRVWCASTVGRERTEGGGDYLSFLGCEYQGFGFEKEDKVRTAAFVKIQRFFSKIIRLKDKEDGTVKLGQC